MSEITSVSSLGGSNIVVQFDLDRDINGAARDIQAAINAAAGELPSGLPNPPSYRKVGGGAKSAVRVQVDPLSLAPMGLSLEDLRNTLPLVNVNRPKGALDGPEQRNTRSPTRTSKS